MTTQVPQECHLNKKWTIKYGKRTRTDNLRPRKKSGYDLISLKQAGEAAISRKFNTAGLALLDSPLQPLLHVMLRQYGLWRGLKLFGQRGDDSNKAELSQLRNKEMFLPKSASSLSQSDHFAWMDYLTFFNMLRDGTFKGLGCANGRKDQSNTDKIEATSPTISTEAGLLFIRIVAKKNRDDLSMDVPGALLQTVLEGEKMHIKLEGRMV